jgi:hypothetical protein
LTVNERRKTLIIMSRRKNLISYSNHWYQTDIQIALRFLKTLKLIKILLEYNTTYNARQSVTTTLSNWVVFMVIMLSFRYICILSDILHILITQSCNSWLPILCTNILWLCFSKIAILFSTCWGKENDTYNFVKYNTTRIYININVY